MSIDPIDQAGHPSLATDRPWQRGDKMIVHKDTSSEETCWLTRQSKHGNFWHVSLKSDLKEEVTSFHPSSLTPADPEPSPEVDVIDRPWQRGDKVIVTKGGLTGRECWLVRASPCPVSSGNGWAVCLEADLEKEDRWFLESSLSNTRPEVSRPASPATPTTDPVVNDPNNLDHIDLVTQHMSYNLGRAVDCLWTADQGDPATSLQELRKAQRNIQIEITRLEWRETNR